MSPAHRRVLPDRHPVEPSRVFEEDLRLSSEPLGIGGSGQVYKGKTKNGKTYAVKLASLLILLSGPLLLTLAKYMPYTEDQIEWMRHFFTMKRIDISDTLIESCFNPWYCESRAYEQIDRYLQDTSRSLFLEYYGTKTIPYSACPRHWCRTVPNHGAVSAIVLELHKKPRPCVPLPLTLDEVTLEAIKDIYSELKDLEYVHVYIHVRELIEILHQLKIIHGDLRLENIMDGLVLLDFGRSTVYIEDFPCIDQLWMRKPRSFDDRSSGTIYAIKSLLLDDYAKKKELRGKLQNFGDCERCKNLREQVIQFCD